MSEGNNETPAEPVEPGHPRHFGTSRIVIAIAVVVVIAFVIYFVNTAHPGGASSVGGPVPASIGQAGGSKTKAPADDTDTITEVPATPALVSLGSPRLAPWDAPVNASGRTSLAGLPMLDAEGTVEHIHTHLTISIDGQAQVVPAHLGIDLVAQRISPLHTHDTSGIIHIESPVKTTFTLGELFTEWDVALSATRIGGYSTADGHTITVFVNGTAVSGDPAALTFANREDIDIVYGAAGSTAVAPPAFVWPANY